MLLSLRNPSPALGVELNTLLLQGVQTMDRYPRPLLPQSPSRPYHPTSHPSFIPSFKACHPPVLIWACHFTSRVSRSLISVGVCLFEPLFAFLWSSLLLLQKTMLVFLYFCIVNLVILPCHNSWSHFMCGHVSCGFDYYYNGMFYFMFYLKRLKMLFVWFMCVCKENVTWSIYELFLLHRLYNLSLCLF